MSAPQLSEALLDQLAALIEVRSGLAMDGAYRRSLQANVSERMSLRGCATLEAYLGVVENPATRELDGLVEDLTVLETRFFRNQAHFRALREIVLPGLQPLDRTIRIWSAGCATGEEPYSLAITCLDAGLVAAGWSVSVIGTDISRSALAAAERGEYRDARITEVAPDLRDLYFERVGPPSAPLWSVRPSVRALVSWKQHNLLDPILPVGAVDVIFCQNVTIYFRPEVTRAISARLASVLREGGVLFPGFSEGAWQGTPGLTLVNLGDCFIYQRGPRPAAAPVRTAPAAVRPSARRAGMPAGPQAAVEKLPGMGAASREGARRRRRSTSTPASRTRPLSGDLASEAAVVGPELSVPQQEQVASHLDAARREASTGRMETALARAQAAVALDPLSVEGWEILGLLLRQAGRRDDAEQAFRRLLYLQPESPTAHFHLASLFRAAGRAGDARREYRNAARLLSALPPDALVADVTADLLLRACQRYEADWAASGPVGQ